MPIGSYVATEVTPPTGYTTSSDPSKVRQEFHWDGKTDVSLVFENDAKVKLELLKLDESNDPLPGAVFNIVKDGQIIATEETGRDGIITVPNVTEGFRPGTLRLPDRAGHCPCGSGHSRWRRHSPGDRSG